MKKRQAKHYYLKISPSRKLAVTLRGFKAKKSKRPNARKQIIIPLYFLPAKEIAFKLEKKKSAKSHRQRPALLTYWRESAFLPAALLLMGLSGILYFGSQALNTGKELENVQTFAPSTPAPVLLPNTPPSLPESEPKQIRIPSVGIDYPVKPVGKKADGTMEVPPLFEPVTGWYKHSPTPGELGPAVIVGHVDTYKGPSVFWRLREIQPGTIIEVTRADGKTVKFKVDALKQFDQANFPTQEVYGNINHSGLRVITCGGTYNAKTERYTENTVVFATMLN